MSIYGMDRQQLILFQHWLMEQQSKEAAISELNRRIADLTPINKKSINSHMGLYDGEIEIPVRPFGQYRKEY